MFTLMNVQYNAASCRGTCYISIQVCKYKGFCFTISNHKVHNLGRLATKLVSKTALTAMCNQRKLLRKKLNNVAPMQFKLYRILRRVRKWRSGIDITTLFFNETIGYLIAC